ncbi:hypothetical protein [Silvimonas soli]|uniref:hypothetical protein n=1 Tax=Silvimonas soli TaxID=2980100 RepID=UPI0024B322DE|nr:hypothetical protein [Silvimonas soli]
MTGKYSPETLLPPLRHFIAARNESIAAGFTDNGGAIHSVERILDTLARRVKYPYLGHINSFKKHPGAERSVGAHEAIQRGENVFIEHVLPQRAFALTVIERVTAGATDEDLLRYISENYRLVLLDAQETKALNRKNRSRIEVDRLTSAGIVIYESNTKDVPLLLQPTALLTN